MAIENMRVTIMGHAGLFIEGCDQRILVDPVLRTDALGSLSVTHAYPRVLDLPAMPRPTLIILTHGHLDHFDPSSLALLDRRIPIVVPDDHAMHCVLRELGFGTLRVLAPWDFLKAGGIELRAVPSHADIDEFGFVVSAHGLTFLHLADAEPSLADARKLRAEMGTMDLASVKFQPASPAHGVFRALGPQFDKNEVAEWLECIAEASPRLSFPYASGVRYQGRHEWLNRYAFPFTSEEVRRLLELRLATTGPAVTTVLPGDVFEISRYAAVQVPRASTFVRHAGGGEEPAWEPIDSQLLTTPFTPEERRELDARLEQLLRQEIGPWIARRSRDEGSPIQKYMQYGVVYQLTVHAGRDDALHYSIDYSAPRLSLRSERHPCANYFAHLSGRALLEVLRGSAGPELFYMS
ncbi:MAG: MBL fold metallo-hydrolase, partial [Myxococcota bacterium]|nr:MBL fold metallo-hydrolase [Myxococcota bacterium]